jgi:glycerol-3-phosphate dehydrogenase (NAD(P)+)
MKTTVQAITILGAGAWGKTLAQLAQERGHLVRLWGRNLGIPLQEALSETEILLSAVSMPGVVPLIHALSHESESLGHSLILVSATKGLDPVTYSTPTQLWQTLFPPERIAVLSGPNLSKEIAKGLPAATVVASVSAQTAEAIQRALSSERFRVYTSLDPLGVELGGTLKNIIAIAVGVCDGLQLGTNAKAALVTRGLAEIIRVGSCLGAQVETFSGLSGLGDLLATCHSPLSRNYQVGYGLAQGKSLSEVLSRLEGTAEGINTAHVLMDIARKHRIAVPISEQVHHLLNESITPQSAVEALMERSVKPESFHLLYE